MLKNFTPARKKVLSFIESSSFPPTVREICKAVGVSSSSTVHSHLVWLRKNGFLESAQPHKQRTSIPVGFRSEYDKALVFAQKLADDTGSPEAAFIVKHLKMNSPRNLL